MVLLKALRPLCAAGAKHNPGGLFYDTEENTKIMEAKGVVERFHEEKMAEPLENKIAPPPDNKTLEAAVPLPKKSAPITTDSLKRKRRR